MQAEFRLLAAFSEPVKWLTSTPGAMALTNAALVNVSAVGGTKDMSAGYAFWLRSWSGAQVAVSILGSAYSDRAGNKGLNKTDIQVQFVCALQEIIQQAKSERN